MPIPDHVTPHNLRRIEFLERNQDDSSDREWDPLGQAWVDENGYVQGDTEYANRVLDGEIRGPNVLAEPRRPATREDGSAMLYGLALEGVRTTYWTVGILEVAEEDEG